jgi:hypothetical protein
VQGLDFMVLSLYKQVTVIPTLEVSDQEICRVSNVFQLDHQKLYAWWRNRGQIREARHITTPGENKHETRIEESEAMKACETGVQ